MSENNGMSGAGSASQSKFSGLKAPSKIGRMNIPKANTGNAIPTSTTGSTASIPTSVSSGANTLTNTSLKSTSSTANIAASNDENENVLDLKVNDRVFVNGTKSGVLAFIGETQFKEGIWAGVILDTADGKNNGSIGGVTYFVTEENRGVFCRLNKLTRTAVNEEAQNVNTTTNNTEMSALKIGERVLVNSSNGTKVGILRYLGTTEFAKGDWAGVELSEKLGKNDGSVGNKRYFQCEPLYGVFAPAQKVQPFPAETINEAASKRQPLAPTVSKSRLSAQPNAPKPLVSSTPTVKTNLVSNMSTSRLKLANQRSESQESLTSETASVYSTASGVAKQNPLLASAKLPPKPVSVAKPGAAPVSFFTAILELI